MASTVAGEDVDALVQRLGHLGDLGNLRQRRLLAEAAVVHLGGLAQLVPADLLDAVVELDGVAVGIVHVHMPVAAGHVASHALDGDPVVLKVGVGGHDLLEAAAPTFRTTGSPSSAWDATCPAVV